MSGTVLDHPLVRDYLRELDQALAALPPQQASELTEQITAHLDEALQPGTTDDEIAAVLARLGRPAELAAEAGAGPAATRPAARPAGRRHWPRLGWRRWTAIGVAAVIVAAAASYLVATATATPIQFGYGFGWWYARDYNHPVYTEADGRDQTTVPIRSGMRQGFFITLINPSPWPETVLGPAPGQTSPGSRSVQLGLSSFNLDNSGTFETRPVRFYLPFTIPPHGVRGLRILWTSTICLRKGQTNGIGQLALRIRVGWLTRTDVIQLPDGFYLRGPSHGPCRRGT